MRTWTFVVLAVALAACSALVDADVTQLGGDADPVTDGDADTDADVEPQDGDADADLDADADADLDADSDTDGESSGDADGESGGDGDGESDGDADGDAGGDADSDADGDADGGSGGDADSDADADTGDDCVFDADCPAARCDGDRILIDSCEDWVCVTWEFASCNDSIDCTVDSCQLFADGALGCLNTPMDALCQDDSECNGEEYCDPNWFGCLPGEPIDCRGHGHR